jgi:hypothetical protein
MIAEFSPELRLPDEEALGEPNARKDRYSIHLGGAGL